MFPFILQGMTVGFSAGVMPGPMQSYLFNTTLKHGWRRALWVIIAPLFVDIPIIIAVLFALEALASVVPVIVDVIRVIGGAFVLYLAWGAYGDYRRNVDITVPSDERDTGSALGTFTQGLMMNVLSPGPYIFWTTVNGPVLLSALKLSLWHGIAFLVAFYGVFLGGWVLMALGIDRLRALGTGVTRWLLLAVTVLLVVFGTFLLWEGVQGLLR